jgi:pimeloyl-ACP methyl ester carboxylesterase
VDRILSYRASTVFYRTEEPAPAPDAADTPVVLIHGFAEDGAIWDRQLEDLKNNHRLIIPDLPGSGRSGLLSGETSMDELAEAIAAILDAEKIGRAILIGHSMGGYVALAFAEKYPDRIMALGIFHSTAYADSEEKKTMRRKSMDFIRRHGPATFIQQSIPNLFAEASKEQHPEWVSGLIDRYAAFNPDSLVYYYDAMIRRPDRSAVLRQLIQPVLFLIGEEDNTIPLEASLQQAHMPQLSLIRILEKTGHMGMLEEAEVSNRILEEFLNFVADHERIDHHSSFNDHQS